MKNDRVCAAVITFLFLLNAVAFGQTGSETLDPKSKAEIKADLTKVVSAVFRADLDTIGKHTHEKVIATVGTKEQFLEAMKQVFSNLEGIELVSVEVSDNMKAFSGELHEFVLVPTAITIKIAGDEQEPNEGYQFGVRKKGETVWKYLDCSGFTTELARSWFTDFPSDVEIPVVE